MALVMEPLPGKHEVLSSKPVHQKQNKTNFMRFSKTTIRKKVRNTYIDQKERAQVVYLSYK
jgi:hypothetical protein